VQTLFALMSEDTHTKKVSASVCRLTELYSKVFHWIGNIVTCVTIWMNLLEFVKVLCLKRVAIMQTNLCSGDLEMLFATLGMFANHSASLVTAHIALDEKLVT